MKLLFNVELNIDDESRKKEFGVFISEVIEFVLTGEGVYDDVKVEWVED